MTKIIKRKGEISMGHKIMRKIHLTHAEVGVLDKVVKGTDFETKWNCREAKNEISLGLGSSLIRLSFVKTDEDFIRIGVLSKKELDVWRRLRAKLWGKTMA